MLEALRNASKNWLGKIVLTVMFSLLILSFAVWGIGDIFRGFGSGTVAKAGPVEIPTEEYRAEYQTMLQNLQRQLGRVITNDQARKEGLDRLVLNRMISEGLVEDRAKTLGLAMNYQAIAKGVLDDPRFRGPTGQFDRLAFQRALSDNGLNEQRFLQKQRETYLRQQLGNSFAGSMQIPRAALEIWHRMGTEARSVEYFTLTDGNAGTIPAPTDKELTAFYESRKPTYRAPEYRKVITLAITPDKIAKPDAVSDEDARKLYEAVKAAKYTVPEKRDVQQIIFKPGEESQAQEALKKIRGGAKFADVASERKLTATDINLGTLAEKDFADPAIAKAAFATKAGETSDVVKSRFGLALVHVVKIEPLTVKSFEDAKAELKKELAASRANDELRKIYEKIEDQRTSGKVLTEAAKAAGYPVRTIDAIDASGRDKAGQELKDLIVKDQFLRTVFESDVGVDNDTITVPSGGYVWFEVAATEPARDRKLEEVKGQVESAWKALEVSKKLRELGEGYVREIEGGKKIADVAKQAGISLESAPDVKRGSHAKLAAGVVNRIFSLPVGKSGTAIGNGLERVVFVINDSTVPPLVDKGQELQRVEKTLENAYQQELFEQYVARLRSGLTVTYNPVAIRNVVGGEAN